MLPNSKRSSRVSVPVLDRGCFSSDLAGCRCSHCRRASNAANNQLRRSGFRPGKSGLVSSGRCERRRTRCAIGTVAFGLSAMDGARPTKNAALMRPIGQVRLVPVVSADWPELLRKLDILGRVEGCECVRAWAIEAALTRNPSIVFDEEDHQLLMRTVFDPEALRTTLPSG